jgi:hypothetical protein
VSKPINLWDVLLGLLMGVTFALLFVEIAYDEHRFAVARSFFGLAFPLLFLLRMLNLRAEGGQNNG